MTKPRISMDLVNKIEDRHQENIEKWGHQDPKILQLVLMEEIGEVSKAFLQAYYADGEATTEDLKSEIIDATAVLVDLYQTMERWDSL